MNHKPVMIEEVLQYLNPEKGEIILDATFGAGGHSRAILMHEPECRVIGLDWDAISLETYAPSLQEEFGDRFIPVWGNFAHLYKILHKQGIDRVHGILADFGTSQMQLKERAGFSFYHDSPLDMRMSPAYQKTTAAYLINKSSPSFLIDLFRTYGQERYARSIVDAIIEQRKKRPFKSTRQLAELIERVVRWQKKGIHPATQVFQALRIYINKELTNIESFLPAAIRSLMPDGRLVCITFHSLEDRIVKQFFKEMAQQGQVELLTKKVVIPSEKEVIENPSARSAKLRAVQVQEI